ncbi:MAG: FAD-dependent thymidylate synthase [bacterium]
MAKFSPQEIELLKKYVTDPEGDVFCVTNMPGMVGAAYARYSRAKGGFRETLLKEFISEGVIDSEHAEKLIQRVLIAFGDDSVGELEGAHLSMENISMIATKEIEECRIGGSPIEQSTRYVFYEQKDDQGNYKYYTDPKIAQSQHAELFKQTMDRIFDIYAELIEPMKDYYKNLKPLDQAEYDILGTGEKQKLTYLDSTKDQKAFRMTYNIDLKTRACDTLRYLLPLATKTNVGIFGNGRFFQGLISSLYSSQFSEIQNIGQSAMRELNKIVPAYVRRAQKDDYRMANETNMAELAKQLLSSETKQQVDEISLLDRGGQTIAKKLAGQEPSPELITKLLEERYDNVNIALMLYAYSELPLIQIISLIESWPEDRKQKVAQTYIGQRRARRDRPYRAMESGYAYTFDLITDFGTYKDLMRHRMTSQLKQSYNPHLGFAMPEDLVKAGYQDKGQECHELSVKLYDALKPEFPTEAQYSALHGSKMRWVMAMNEREAYHLLELRTTPQGHRSYRKACQQMHKLIQKRSPWRAQAMKFVDHNDYDWARADSEAKQRVKERKLDQK